MVENTVVRRSTRSDVRSTIMAEMVDMVRSAVRGIPDKLAVEDVRLGVYYTGVKLSSGHGGVAYTPVHEVPQSRCCPLSQGRMPSAGKMTDLCLGEFIDLALSDNLFERAVGVASLNAVSQLLMEEGRPGFNITGEDTLDLIHLTKDDIVGIVGAFPPVIKWARAITRNIYVLEKNPRAQVDMELHAEEASEHILPRCTVVVMTGATIVNHTFQGLLEKCRAARHVLFLGPTASMIPEPLFDHGVTLLGGIKVYDADRMIRVIGEGGSGSHFFETCAHKMSIYRA